MPGPNTPSKVYQNPFRQARVSPARIDQGVDYNGRVGDPIFALGPGVIDQVFAGGSGWPGGGWVSYRLTSGPARGRRVFVAEDIAPANVKVGQRVNSGTVIARFNQLGSIETGWAGPLAAGDQTLAASLNEWDTTGGDPGRFSTEAGVTFSNMIASLGGPSGILTPGGIRGPGQQIIHIKVDSTLPQGNCPAGSVLNPFTGKCGPDPTLGAGQVGAGINNSPDCLISSPKLFGIGGSTCIFTRSEARALIGGGLLLIGAGPALVGVLILVASGFKKTGALDKAGQIASVVPGPGRAVGTGIRAASRAL